MARIGTSSGDQTHVSAFNSIDNCLIATLQPDVDEQYIVRLGADILEALRRGRHRTLIMDSTPLELIDATDFDRLRKVIDQARLMGVGTIIVGLRPGVAASLVELGANVEGLVTTLNLEEALCMAAQSEHRI